MRSTIKSFASIVIVSNDRRRRRKKKKRGRGTKLRAERVAVTILGQFRKVYLFKKIVTREGQPLAPREKRAKRGGDLALSEVSPGMLAHDIPRLCDTLNISNASRSSRYYLDVVAATSRDRRRFRNRKDRREKYLTIMRYYLDIHDV